MPTYIYKAKSFSGESKHGTAEAKDEQELAKILHQQSYVLISAVVEGKTKKRRIDFDFLKKFKKISLKDKLMFTRNLGVMVKASVPLSRSLEILSFQVKSKKFKIVLQGISEKIRQGKPFSSAIREYPHAFSDIFCHMVKVGEETGTLGNVLENLSRQIERDYELRSKVKSALIYPIVIISIMIMVVILMLVVVVPKLSDIFQDLNVVLPLTTRMLIGLGTFLRNHFLLFIIIILFLCFLFKLILQNPKGRRIKDGFFLKLPIIAPLIKKVNASRMVRNLGILIGSGVSFVSSLKIVAGIFSNMHFKEAILLAKEKVQAGEKFSESLKEYQNIFPSIVVQMLKVGEETGETSKILEQLADFFEQEVDIATKNLVSAIEPLLMILVGIVVGFFAISMIQPIYSMLEAF